MNAWWSTLSVLEQFFYYIAIPATILLSLQTIMTFIGLDNDADVDMGDDLDMDGPGDGDFDTDLEVSFQMFTFRNFVAFFTFFGWGGVWASGLGISMALVALIAFALGLVAMMFSAGLFYLIQKMATSGNLVITLAIGKVGTVYLPIPESRNGQGKINVTVQGTYRELDAVTDENSPITTGTEIIVLGVLNSTTLIVKPHTNE